MFGGSREDESYVAGHGFPSFGGPKKIKHSRRKRKKVKNEEK